MTFIRPLLLLVVASTAAAQSTANVEVSVQSIIGGPLSYSTIDVTPGRARFTSEAGRYLFDAKQGSTYRIRVKHLGFGAVDTTVVIRDAGLQRVLVTMRPVALHLAEISVRDNNSCGRTGSGAELAVALEELQKNAERDVLLRNQYPFVYRLAREYDTYDIDAGIAGKRRDTSVLLSTTSDRYKPGNNIRRTSGKRPRSVRELRIPTLQDFADPIFFRSHCFSFGGVAVVDHALTYKIDFQPASSLRGSTDFAGSAYLDAATYMIKRADFSMTNPGLANPPVIGLEVSTTFKEIFRGVAVFDHIRGVQRVSGRGFGGSRGEQVDDQRLVSVVFRRDIPGER